MNGYTYNLILWITAPHYFYAGYLHEAGPEAREEYLAGVERGIADLEHENRILQLQLSLHVRFTVEVSK